MSDSVVSFSGNVPLYMVAAHRLTRLGLASVYSTTKRLVQLNLTTPSGEIFAAKWPPLKDAQALTIIYQDRRV